jgi:hypothetical protein
MRDDGPAATTVLVIIMPMTGTDVDPSGTDAKIQRVYRCDRSCN